MTADLILGPEAAAEGRERPIIMSAPMVRAILEGRKTQTRRALKPQPFIDGQGNFCAPDRKGKTWNYGQHWDGKPCTRNYMDEHVRWRVGDRLWVRETWARVGDNEDDIHACPNLLVHAYYRADSVQPETLRWRPSIHMPRWASRITLLVTGVRVERLQDISEADVDAEGFGGDYPHAVMPDVFPPPIERWGELTMQECYARLWDAINGRSAWDANPWVVVIEFKREVASADPR